LFRERLEGISLEVRLAREGVLPQREAFAIIAQVAAALDSLHSAGLLHHDVKPGHIFLLSDAHSGPEVRLLDAGVTGPIESRTAATIQGTAGYLAPELLSGKLVSFRSDLYSLGCVLYRMLTGHSAFPGETLEE